MKPKLPGGFTLLEMTVALTILALFMAAVFGVMIPLARTYHQGQLDHQLSRQTEATLISLDRMVSESFGWLEGDTLSMALITRQGDTLRIRRDSTRGRLLANRRSLSSDGFRVENFLVRYRSVRDSSGSPAIGGALGQADRDQDGVVRGSEILDVVSLELKLTLAKGGRSFSNSVFPAIPSPIVDIELGE